MKRYAVIGTTGFLGRTFFDEAHDGVEMLPIGRGLADLTQSFEKSLRDYFKAYRVEAAIITAAVSSPDECKLKPELSRAINVDGTIRLLKLLKEFEIKPVLFSSDHVYDGTRGNYNESAEYAPINEYGRQKAETETFLRENFDEFLILRTSKQVSTKIHKKNVLSEMILRLLTGRNIRCASDHFISPIFTEDIVQITLAALNKGLSGPLHLAPPETYSRLELGQKVADLIHVPQSQVESCSIQDFKFVEVRPPHCTLDSSLLRTFLNPKFTSLESGVAAILENRKHEAARFNSYAEPALP
jgi:dTDP-4-dehydrorhamnose reductase